MQSHKSFGNLLLLVGACAAGCAAGCADRPAVWTTDLQILGPFKVADRVMWVDGTRGRVFALDPGPTEPVVAAAVIDPHATYAVPSPSRKKLLVLTAGQDPLK